MAVFLVQTAFLKCPSCKSAVDANVMSFSSFLGPSAVACHWCGTVVATERAEWWELNGTGKGWFVIASLFYMVLAFLFGGLGTNVGLHFLEKNEFRKDWGITEPSFWIGGGVWAGLVAAIQIHRVLRSLGWQRDIERKPLRRPLLTFQVGGQIKLLILMMLAPAICWVVGLIIRMK